MPAYVTYRCFNIPTQSYLGTVPVESVSFNRRKPPEVGTLNGVVDLAAAFGVKTRDGLFPAVSAIGSDNLAVASLIQMTNALTPGNLLVVDFGQVPIWWGIISRPVYDSDNSQIQVAAEEVWSYFRDYPLRQNLDYGPTPLQDQTSVIFKGLLDWVQSQSTWANIHVQTTTSTIVPSGVLRERHYAAQDRKLVGELCGEIAGVDNGFEFWIDCQYGANRFPQLIARTGYPRIGQRYNPANPSGSKLLSFDKDAGPGSNVLRFALPQDFLSVAAYVDAVSHNVDGSVGIATSPVNQVLRDNNIPERIATTNWDGVTDVTGTLQGHANAVANRSATLTTIPTIYMRMQDCFGYLNFGDDVRVALKDWFFPNRLQATWRFIGLHCDVNAETVQLDLDTTVA